MATRNLRTGRMQRDLTSAQTDAEAVHLRSQGLSYPQIAERMGCSLSVAHDRVQRGLAAVPAAAVHELRAQERARLELLIVENWKVANSRHPLVQQGRVFPELEDVAPRLAALREIRALSESLRKLDGLDAPTRSRVEVITEDAVDAAIQELEAELAERSATGEAAAAR